jgi:hypothetical protein
MKLITTKVTLLILFGALTSAVNVHANEMIDYKCFVETTKGIDITFYKWKPATTELMQAKLPATKYKDVNSKDVYIKDVVECVELDEKFKSKSAKDLDKKTVR